MTIQQSIEKAIEGGYMKAKDYFGYIPSVVKEVHYNKPEKLHQGHNFFERTSGSFHFGSAKKYSFSISVNEIFLDPLFWQSLYGSEKYGRIKAIEFINAIFDGKSAEKFFEQESDLGKEQQEKALS